MRGKLKTGADVSAASAVGALMLSAPKKQVLQRLFFDRGGYIYHGACESAGGGCPRRRSRVLRVFRSWQKNVNASKKTAS